jgi:hypothetical protein
LHSHRVADTIKANNRHSRRGSRNVKEWIAMSVLVVVLVAVGAYYLRKAIRVLGRTTPAFELLPEDRTYLRQQAWRRIVNSGLMFLLAAIMVGSYASGIQQRADEINRDREQAAVEGKKPPLTPEQSEFAQLFTGVLITMLILLGLIVCIAGIDLFATRRYALTQLRRIQSDRRAMLERQLARWREERDGPSLT